ncbi:hypothetical protein AFEL58S_02081 [Afipia felis]
MTGAVHRMHLVAAETVGADQPQTCLKCGWLLLGRAPHRTIFPYRWQDSPRNCERIGPKPAKIVALASGNGA